MTRDDDDLDKLERLLAGAHRARSEPQLAPAWTSAVMRDIRRAAVQGPRERSAWIERYIWRTAAAAAMFAAMFAGSAVWYTDAESGDLAAVLAEGLDPAPTLIE